MADFMFIFNYSAVFECVHVNCDDESIFLLIQIYKHNCIVKQMKWISDGFIQIENKNDQKMCMHVIRSKKAWWDINCISVWPFHKTVTIYLFTTVLNRLKLSYSIDIGYYVASIGVFVVIVFFFLPSMQFC